MTHTTAGPSAGPSDDARIGLPDEARRDRMVRHSIAVIAGGQAASGAYVASPAYPTYRFAWLRDGSFCADAMDRHGEHDSAARFHAWVCRTVTALAATFETAIAALPGGVAVLPPTRFELDGTLESGEEDWPNFQLDGYGTWLWAFASHVRGRGSDLTTPEREAVRLVARYLDAAGDAPCYDCWEESVERRHAATLAASVAGLRCAADLLGDNAFADRAEDLAAVLADEFVVDGSFVKHDATTGVDASLLWLALPFGVVDVDDPRFVETARRVDAELLGPGGGIRRYRGDTFYGGGDWILLTAWSGWAHAAAGRRREALERLAWVESRATDALDLPEQVHDHPQSPDHVAEWVDRWGGVATPLLWSHAMYLVLVDQLETA